MDRSKITKETYLNWYTLMLRIRRFEEKAAQLYGQQKIRGFLHLYIGQEAIAAGMVSAIHPDDPVITAYRDHGLAIARGISMRAAMAELFGKATGCSHGKGGSMHFFSKEHFFFGGHGIVGAQIPIGAGIAFAEKYRKSGKICLCFMGDGAVRQGSLHETFNMSMLWQLPVVFICENNGYAMGTSEQRSSAVKDIYQTGEAYNMPSFPVDGMNPESVHNAIYEAAEKARAGEGPTFLEMRTYRYRGHSMSDPAKYRSKEELEEYKLRDPLETTAEKMRKMQYATQKDLDMMEEKTGEEVSDCVQFAEDSPWPDEAALYEDIYTQADYPFITD